MNADSGARSPLPDAEKGAPAADAPAHDKTEASIDIDPHAEIIENIDESVDRAGW